MHSQIRARFIATQQEIAAPGVTATCYWVIIVISLRDEEMREERGFGESAICHRRICGRARYLRSRCANLRPGVDPGVLSLCVSVVVSDHVTR